ncbi:MAG TPA: TraB/GumN family protein, partial [Stellaceae bacterium]|nr:TraB/GumN family protein [Stellaceae bacterium]
AALAFSLFTLPALAEPALWVAKQGAATVYLFGTVHALKPELKWETPKIAKAFAESQEFWMEADDADAKTMQPIVAELGLDRAHPLSTLIPPADLPRLDAAAKAAGLPGETALEPMRPWLAALTLAALPIVKAGYDPAKGADNILKGEAAAAGKPMHGLETAEQQMHFFADLPQARQVDMLRAVLDEVAGGTAEVEEIMAAWEKADLATIDKDMNEDDAEKYPDLHAILIVNRNKVWAARIAEWLKSGKGVTFLAVGAAHLVGHDSVQEGLKARGIAVERVE